MKVLLGHTYYLHRGGEDSVVEEERALLESHGCEVVFFSKHNEVMETLSRSKQVQTLIRNEDAAREITELIQREKPDVAHFHNTFQAMSPAVLVACKNAGVPVVQTLHNYRLLCPGALFLRDSKPCELCLTKQLKWPAVRYSCYRDSKAASLATSVMLYRNRHVYKHAVDKYICLTEFAREKMKEAGYPASRLAVKPNFLRNDPGVGSGEGAYFLFVGRFSAEKGVKVLLDAMRLLRSQGFTPPVLKLAGDGPDFAHLKAAYGNDPGIEFLGNQEKSAVLDLMRRAMVLVVPSIWYEGLPMTIVEGLATGLPLVVPRLGALPTLAPAASKTFEAGDSESLATTLREVASDPTGVGALRVTAREIFDAVYSPERNYAMLREIYEQAIGR